MPIVKIYGGLGNQLFEFSFAYMVSRKVNEEITLDVSFFKNRKWPDFQLDKFNIVKYNSICFSERNKLNRFLSNVYRRVKYLGYSFYKEEDPYYSFREGIEHKKTFYNGYFANANYFNHLRNDLKAMYNANYSFNHQANELLSEIHNSNSVAVHFRRGDYVKIGCAIDNSYYYRAIKDIKSAQKDLKFFVFSNDMDYAIAQIKQIDENIELIPVDILDDPNKDVTEFCLMKECKHFIIANSTFSWWAAYLADRDDCVYVPYVKQWNERTYLKEWKMIEAKIQ